MTGIYKLYGRPNSGSLAVQVALEECAVPYERIWISAEPADVAQYRTINPTGKVPALMLPDGTVMFESAAMLIHLAQAYPQAQLAPPAGTPQHALFLQWMVYLSANVYESALRMYYPARYLSRGDADADAVRGQGTTDFCANLALIGQKLDPYVLGDRYSIADVYLYMLASWYPDGKTALHARLPVLAAHARLLAARPALVKAEADHNP